VYAQWAAEDESPTFLFVLKPFGLGSSIVAVVVAGADLLGVMTHPKKSKLSPLFLFKN